MKFNLRKPCKQCPYLAQVEGWIGGHDTAQDFHDAVQADVRFPCHKTTEAYQEKPTQEQHCAGYAMYMNAICKRSHDLEMMKLQDQVEGDNKLLLDSFDGSKLVEFHGR